MGAGGRFVRRSITSHTCKGCPMNQTGPVSPLRDGGLPEASQLMLGERDYPLPRRTGYWPHTVSPTASPAAAPANPRSTLATTFPPASMNWPSSMSLNVS